MNGTLMGSKGVGLELGSLWVLACVAFLRSSTQCGVKPSGASCEIAISVTLP